MWCVCTVLNVAPAISRAALYECRVKLNWISSANFFKCGLRLLYILRCWNNCRVLLFKRNRYCEQDYFLFNLNECQESAQKTNKQRLFVVMAANKIKSGVSGIWTERARKLYAFSCCLIFSLWKLIERKNCADEIYVYRFSCDRYALYCGLVDGKTSEEKKLRYVSNRQPLFVTWMNGICLFRVIG